MSATSNAKPQAAASPVKTRKETRWLINFMMARAACQLEAGPRKDGRTTTARRFHPGPRTGHNLQVLFDVGRKLAKSGGLDKRSIFWLPMRKIWA
jgi:hypothetical protein